VVLHEKDLAPLARAIKDLIDKERAADRRDLAKGGEEKK